MQYTGQGERDQEIYEKDIVEFEVLLSAPDVTGKLRGVVEYLDLGWSVVSRLNDGTETEECLSLLVKDGDIEVIGNIYENPELLKEL